MTRAVASRSITTTNQNYETTLRQPSRRLSNNLQLAGHPAWDFHTDYASWLSCIPQTILIPTANHCLSTQTGRLRHDLTNLGFAKRMRARTAPAPARNDASTTRFAFLSESRIVELGNPRDGI